MKFRYILLLFIGIISAYYLYQDQSLISKLMGKVHQVAPELNRSTLYKWQNNKGEWQITDQPPAKGISFTTISSQDQINVIPGPASENKK